MADDVSLGTETCPVCDKTFVDNDDPAGAVRHRDAHIRSHHPKFAVMRQALAKLEEALPFLEDAETCLDDMPPIAGPVLGQSIGQTVGEAARKVHILTEALKAAINGR